MSDFIRNINQYDIIVNGVEIDSGHIINNDPTIRSYVQRPENYEKMVEIAKILAEPFSYVRVDLYNVSGAIYFGEMTFAHESGGGEFTSKGYDLWMGNLWQGDPRY